MKKNPVSAPLANTNYLTKELKDINLCPYSILQTLIDMHDTFIKLSMVCQTHLDKIPNINPEYKISNSIIHKHLIASTSYQKNILDIIKGNGLLIYYIIEKLNTQIDIDSIREHLTKQ